MLEYYNKLAETGVLGLMLVFCFVVIAYQNRRIEKLSDLRVEDAKESRDLLVEPVRAIQKTVDLILNQLSSSKNL